MRMWKRFSWLALGLTLALSLSGCGESTGGPDDPSAEHPGDKPLNGKVIGFAQVGAESDWRTANTRSIKRQARASGYTLKFADANQKPEKQVGDVANFIAQKVDAIILEPIVETGWESVLKEAKDAGIPVVMGDRRAAVPEDYYVTFIGSDFIEEGRKAGNWLAKKMNDKATIFQLEGTMGSAPQIDRKKGFEEIISTKPDMKIIKSQTGEFTRQKGKEVMEAFFNSPEGKTCTALFAHNDDMALGAIQAIEAAGKKPGTDIIIISMDGTPNALQAMIDGKLNCSVECNPLLGPLLIDAVDKILAGQGKTLEKRVNVKEGMYDQSQAKDELPHHWK